MPPPELFTAWPVSTLPQKRRKAIFTPLTHSGHEGDGKAPAIFRKCTKNGLPIYCLILTAAFGLLAYMSCGSSASKIFNDFVNLSSITGLVSRALSTRVSLTAIRAADLPSIT